MNLRHFKEKKSIYIKYTLLFLLCSFGVFYIYYSSGKSLIYDGDGWSQHFKAYLYYSDYLKKIIHNIFINHKIVIPQWDFSIGEGADIIGTFHYYVIGDPFAFLTIFIPNNLIYLYFNFSILLRIWLAGIIFCKFCIYMKKDNNIAILSGAIIYVFCFWSIFNSVRHIYFLNPMIYLPLVLLGFEKIINEESPSLFVIAVWLCCLSNFYFFYNVVLLTIIYIFTRLLFIYKKDFKKIFGCILVLSKYSILAVLMSAIILLPIINVFLSDARMGIDFDHHLLYPLLYYYKLPSMLISTSRYYWLCMGFASPVLLAVISTALRMKKNWSLFLLNVIAIIMILFPIFGQIMNGFSYISNKWSFGIAMLAAYNMVEQWNYLKDNKKQITILYCLFSFVCLVFGSGININIPLIICFAFLLLVYYKTDNKKQILYNELLKMTLIMLNVVFLANWQYAEYGSNYSSYATTIKDNQNIYTMSEAYHMSTYDKDGSFFRYSGSNLTQNASVIFGTHSTDYYWSLTNPFTAEYRTALSLDEYKLYNFKEFDKRATLYNLASVKYYVTPKEYNQLLPYGFEYKETIGEYDVYENNNFIPFGFTYDKVVSLNEWNKLNSSQKEEVLSQAIVIDSDKSDNYITTSKNEKFEVVAESGTEYMNNRIIVNRDGASVLLKFDSLENRNYYLNICGLNYDDGLNWLNYKTTQVEIDFLTSNNIEKSIIYGTSDDKYGNGRKDFTINLGANVNSVKMTFPFAGTYSFEQLFINSCSLENYATTMNNLKRNSLRNISISDNIISGNINVENSEYLFLSIPYSKGWKSFVDDKEVETLNANVGYIGIHLEKGNHNVRLEYTTPYLKEGSLISVIAIIVFTMDSIYRKKRNDKK